MDRVGGYCGINVEGLGRQQYKGEHMKQTKTEKYEAMQREQR